MLGLLGKLNPMRYRSYYHDVETGYYYLQSRYYDAQWGRFINGDEPELVSLIHEIGNSMNLFSYCNNNLILYSDQSGSMALPAAIKVGFAAKFGLDLAGKALLLKMTAFLIAALPWLLVAIAAVILDRFF